MGKIEVKKLKFKYRGEKLILDDFSFVFEEGKYYTILGHNGSGKSTLAKLICGLLVPVAGEIYINDELMTEKNYIGLRKRIGIVFQNPDNQFIGGLVKDDIAFGLENNQVPHALMEDIIINCARKVRMEEYLEKEPSQLSGGQKQRVAIAGVIALNPEIIIFDEATSMLDPLGRNEINQLISEMRKDNPRLTIIAITHDIESALLADQLIVLDQGKMVVTGIPLKVFLENDLTQYHLDNPFFIKLLIELKKAGVKIDDASDLEGVVEQVCRLIS